MRTTYTTLPVLFLLFSLFASGQGVTGTTGAKAWMMGGASVAEADVWSVNNNPAAMAFIENSQLGLYTEQRFRESRLKLANLSGVVKTKYIHIGGLINYYGYDVFNQQKLGLSLGKQLGRMISVGIQLNYLITNIKDYGNTGAYALGAGVLVRPVDKMRLGFMVFNPTQNKYALAISDRIPTYARLGAAYDVSKKVLVQAEADQGLESGTKMSLRGGINYKVHEVISLAVGAANNPVYYTFGTSLHIKQFKLDIASSFHEVLGFTPHLGLALPVKK